MSIPRRVLVSITVASVVVAVVVVRVLHGAWTEFRAGDMALESGDLEQAVTHYERCLHWYVPFGATSARALDALWRIGEQAEAAGDRDLAMEAFQAIRSGLYATRSFYMPHRAWLRKVDERIAAIQVAYPGGAWPDPSLPDRERMAVALETLARDPSPNPAWAALAVGGFLGWIAAAAGFIWRGVDSAGRWTGRRARWWALGFVVSYILWVVGMARA